jgi:hypothetical protein
MSFHADLGGRKKPVHDGEQLDLTAAMTPAIAGNGFEAEIYCTGGSAGSRRMEVANKATAPRHLLKYGQFVPGI